MKIQTILIFIAVLFFSSLALADVPPTWDEFEIRSANGKYSAEVKVKDKPEGTIPYLEWNYKLTVFEIGETLKTLIWSCDYDYDGYSDGILSDDGSTFIYVSFWYYEDQPVVSIYRKGKKVGVLYGKDFNIDQSKLGQGASHQLWLKEGSPYRFSGTETLPLVLEITTIDEKKHIINVKSGKFLK